MIYPQLTVKTTQEVTGRIQEINRDYVAKAEEAALKAIREEEYRVTKKGSEYLLSTK